MSTEEQITQEICGDIDKAASAAFTALLPLCEDKKQQATDSAVMLLHEIGFKNLAATLAQYTETKLD